MKQLVKALSHDGLFPEYIERNITRISIEKLKASIFDGLQRWQLINDDGLTTLMNELEYNWTVKIFCVTKRPKIMKNW